MLLTQLKAGQLIKNDGDTLRQIGLVTKVYQSKPEFVPQAIVYWLYYKDSPIMVGEATQIDTRQIYTGGGFKVRRFRSYVIMQDEGGKSAAPKK